MRAPYTQLYLYCVWATWDRLPLLTPEIEPAVRACILTKCQELKCVPLKLGGVEDHLHLLVRLHATVSVATLLKEVKGASSHLVTHKVRMGEFFKWQGAYGAFTLARGAVPEVSQYIENQRDHHSRGTLWVDFERRETDEADS